MSENEKAYYSEIHADLLKQRIISINDEFTAESCSYWAGRIILLNKDATDKSTGKITNKKPPIVLLINSSGGSIYNAFGLIDIVKKSTIPVVTVCIGEASSAASMLLASGKKRYATENSTIMVHTLWEEFSEGEKLTKQGADVWKLEFDRTDALIKEFWKVIFPPEISKKQLEHLLHKDSYLSPEQAKQLNIIDFVGFRF